MDDTTPSGHRHRLLLTAHVTASVGVLGADLVLLALGVAGVAGAAPVSVYPAARLVAAYVVAPLALAALATGLWLALSTSWGLFRYWWVAIKLAITLSLTVAVLFVLLPALGATADAATTGAGLSTRQRAPLVVAPALASSLLLVAATLGIFKPRRRIAWSVKRDSASGHRGLRFPRLYDVLLGILTRGREAAYRDRTLDLAAVAPGDDVLDVGCGTGTQAVAAWHRTGPGGSVTGIDVSEHMLAAARNKARRAGAEVTFRAADATSLPFADETFDAVIVATVLHMLPDDRLRPCLEEAFRVLRPGGRLLLVDYAGEPGKREHRSARLGPHGRFDLDRLREPLADTGFRDITAGPVGWMSLHFLRGSRSR